MIWKGGKKFSSPVIRGSYRSDNLGIGINELIEFSSPVIRGSYRSVNKITRICGGSNSRPLLFGVVIDHCFVRPILFWVSRFSSPVIRGSYRSDTLINSITTKVQVLFWLSKTVTTNTMLLYEMSLFLTNIMIIFYILRVYYI